jgi:hypothetical protein
VSIVLTLCDRRFVNDIARCRHLIDSTTCNVVETVVRLQFLLADRDEAVAVAGRQRDEARSAAGSRCTNLREKISTKCHCP